MKLPMRLGANTDTIGHSSTDGLPMKTINLGAIAVAVLFSILPAIRAARLQPVQALRYE